MGNCQAIDNATLVIQHPGGKAEKLFTPVVAREIMKINPGHYVALLLTTTLYTSASAVAVSGAVGNHGPLRVTRIKLLRPGDSLLLGHSYRLVTAQEVMKGLGAKKMAKLKQQQSVSVEKRCSDFGTVARKTEGEVSKQVNNSNNNKNNGRQKSSNKHALKGKGWQPSLNSISEAAAGTTS